MVVRQYKMKRASNMHARVRILATNTRCVNKKPALAWLDYATITFVIADMSHRPYGSCVIKLITYAHNQGAM